MLLWKSCRDKLIWRRLALFGVVGVRVHVSNSLETARYNSLLVGGPKEGQAVHLSGGTFIVCAH